MNRRGSLLAYAGVLSAGIAAIAATAALSCSQGEGAGHITGTLNVPNCWTGPFDLSADFLGGVPFRETLQLRIQSGSDYQSFSDGLSILLSDTTRIRPDRYRQPLVVDIPPGVTPSGVPVKAKADPAIVSLSLYLQQSCRTQNNQTASQIPFAGRLRLPTGLRAPVVAAQALATSY